MAITETLNEGLKRGYIIKVTAAELDSTVNAKLTEAPTTLHPLGRLIWLPESPRCGSGGHAKLLSMSTS